MLCGWKNSAPRRSDIEIALQGNLCRCTGYISIINGIEENVADQQKEADPLHKHRLEMSEKLQALDLADPHLGYHVYAPRNLDALVHTVSEVENPRFVAGATDVGIWLTKHHAHLGESIFLGNVEELEEISFEDGQINIGAAVTYTRAQNALRDAFPELNEYWNVIAGAQIRNLGTLGGNLANGSPIGDMAPVLLALEAKLLLNNQGARRELDLDNFFLDYKKLDLNAGEIVERILYRVSTTNYWL